MLEVDDTVWVKMHSACVLGLLVLVGWAGSSGPQGGLVSLSKEHTIVLNTVVDAILSKARDAMQASGKDTIAIPDVKETFYKGWKYMHISGEFEGTKGWLGKLTSVKRTGDAILYTTEDGIKLTASLGLGDLRVGFDSYTAKVALTKLQGSTEVRVGDNSASLEILLHYDDDKCTAQLESVDIERVGDIKVTITGGWKVSDWFYGKIGSYVVNHAKQSIRKEVTQRLFNDFTHALVEYDICKEIPPVH
ncbi:hypothetical protein AAG570_011723 [Ranatra chinensis]|uniref:Uncharacterized protein n=1 Tax=Ranatra chinensis TaxID=642074 RepID=A0ABD0YGR1_9HEMI